METRVSMAEGIWLEPHRHQPGLSIIYPINPVGPRPFHRHAIAAIRVATPPEPACWYCTRQACQQAGSFTSYSPLTSSTSQPQVTDRERGMMRA